MNVYVSFDDSHNDPTYTNAESAYLIIPVKDEGDTNPCRRDNVGVKVPVLPSNLDEIKAFCSIMGFELHFDTAGQAIIHTGVY